MGGVELLLYTPLTFRPHTTLAKLHFFDKELHQQRSRVEADLVRSCFCDFVIGFRDSTVFWLYLLLYIPRRIGMGGVELLLYTPLTFRPHTTLAKLHFFDKELHQQRSRVEADLVRSCFCDFVIGFRDS